LKRCLIALKLNFGIKTSRSRRRWKRGGCFDCIVNEMIMEVKWGIIGAGDVTEVKSGLAFQQVEHSQLVAVMRRDAEKAKSYADRHGVPRWYTHAQRLIEDPEVNAIYIATPPDTHGLYATAALQAGKP